MPGLAATPCLKYTHIHTASTHVTLMLVHTRLPCQLLMVNNALLMKSKATSTVPRKLWSNKWSVFNRQYSQQATRQGAIIAHNDDLPCPCSWRASPPAQHQSHACEHSQRRPCSTDMLQPSYGSAFLAGQLWKQHSSAVCCATLSELLWTAYQRLPLSAECRLSASGCIAHA